MPSRTRGVTMTRTRTLLVDNAVDETAVRAALRTLNMRRFPSTTIFINIQEHVDLLQELAEGDAPLSGRMAFYEAFGIELKEVAGILVPPGFDESIKLPESIPNRLVANSDGTVTDMTFASANT